MTRINTNVSSLVARSTLGRSNAALEQSLTRLSTGLRINTGKDDPAGLIASENLRSDITSIRRAISNTDRANQVIATADSALGQVSSLLNDIRGLVTESANAGAMSDAQLAANQLQVDSSLEALNRIAQTTTFQGRRLLDGSLDFTTTTADADFVKVSSLQIDQANLGATGVVPVSVNVSAAATQAQVNVASIPASGSAATAATGNLVIGVQTTAQAQASRNYTTAGGGAYTIAVKANPADSALNGAGGNAVSVVIAAGTGATGATFAANVLTINVDDTNATVSLADIKLALDADTDFSDNFSFNIGTAGVFATGGSDDQTSASLQNGVNQVVANQTIAITAVAGNNNIQITLAENSSATAGTPVVTGNAGSGYTVTVNDTGNTTIQQIRAAIESIAEVATATYAGSATYNGTNDAPPSALTLSGGAAATTGGIADAVVFELTGSTGAEVLSFGAGTSITQLVTGINLLKDATGVEAAANGTTLELKSTGYGKSALVDLKIIAEGSGSVPSGVFSTAAALASRDEGTDIVATINGIVAKGQGNSLSINTAALDLSATIAAGFTGQIDFNITGGGALFQLGPDVVSNQQARLGIGSVNTARLGGPSGKLFQLGNGNAAALANDATTAARIVAEAIDQVTSLRGRLGAFQRTTLETNKNALNDTLTNLTDAESTIRDADFAAESAALTRAQILVQSGMTVLQIANTNPQNVLSLLR